VEREYLQELDHKVHSIENVYKEDYLSRLLTTDGVFYSRLSFTQLLENACILYCSTLEGRIQAVRKVMGYRHKTPVIIIPDLVSAFPTESYKKYTCVWIFNHPFQIEVLGKKKCKVIFEDGQFIIVNVSKEVLLSQQQRSDWTLEKFRQNQQNMNRIIEYHKVRNY
jgi:competence protein ComK